MAKLLLVKLLEPDPVKRYSADKALSHPWITKNIHSNIPKTYLESMEANQVRRKILQARIIILIDFIYFCRCLELVCFY